MKSRRVRVLLSDIAVESQVARPLRLGGNYTYIRRRTTDTLQANLHDPALSNPWPSAR